MTWSTPWSPFEDPDLPEPTRIDPERLAALIDGRLGEADAAAMRVQLAEADADTLAAYADAVALAGELQERGVSASGGEVQPIASARTARRRWLMPAIVAAAAGIVAVAVLRSREDGASSINVAAGLPRGALDVPAWGTARSGDAPVTDRGRAVRVGVLLVQYDLLARRADSAAAERAAMIAAQLDDVPAGSAAAARWREIARARTASERATAADAEVARSLVDSDFVQLGAWLEGARTAATAGQTAWFDAHDDATLKRVSVSPGLPSAHREALAAVERSLATRPLDSHAVAAAIAAAEITLAR